MIGVNPSIARVPYGGCYYKYARGENLGIAPLSKECSKALWQFPITKFDESYDIGYGFGDGDKDRPYGDGLFDEKVHEYAHDLIDDADWNWERCFGREPFKNPDAPCYATFNTQTPKTCACDLLRNQSAMCTGIKGYTCPLGQSFTAENKDDWSAANLVPACFPQSCTRDDIESITKYIVHEWVANVTDPDAYELTGVTVPAGECAGASNGEGKSKTKDAEIAGGVVGGLLLVGALVGGAYVYRQRKSTVGGLNTKFMTTARQNRGAL
jgi:hypothetical protein